MTLVAVPIEVEDPRDVATALEQAQQAKSGGADLVEFRIDVLVEHAEGATAAAAPRHAGRLRLSAPRLVCASGRRGFRPGARRARRQPSATRVMPRRFKLRINSCVWNQIIRVRIFSSADLLSLGA